MERVYVAMYGMVELGVSRDMYRGLDDTALGLGGRTGYSVLCG